MNGRIWVGRQSLPAGRAGEGASLGLTEHLLALGFESDRLKTGTPARVDIRSIDFSRLQVGLTAQAVLPTVKRRISARLVEIQWPPHRLCCSITLL